MIYYHGTSTVFNLVEGDVLLPSSRTGVLREEWRKKFINKVFVTSSKLSAIKFAKKAAEKYGGEPVVYVVKPSYPCYNNNTNEWITDSARIMKVEEKL